MRIISGKYRGKQLLAPRNLPVRPTTDFAKEALFNLLQNYFHLENIQVLDLFAGTGNISYEFASRGTQHITAVDKNFLCVRYINQTTEKLAFTGLQAIKADAVQFVNRAYQKWDVIFADPPYDFAGYNELVDGVLSRKLLTEDGILVIEHGKYTSFSDHPNFFDERKYGNVHFSFFQLQEAED